MGAESSVWLGENDGGHCSHRIGVSVKAHYDTPKYSSLLRYVIGQEGISENQSAVYLRECMAVLGRRFRRFNGPNQ